jgi:hypothetical protein
VIWRWLYKQLTWLLRLTQVNRVGGVTWQPALKLRVTGRVHSRSVPPCWTLALPPQTRVTGLLLPIGAHWQARSARRRSSALSLPARGIAARSGRRISAGDPGEAYSVMGDDTRAMESFRLATSRLPTNQTLAVVGAGLSPGWTTR